MTPARSSRQKTGRSGRRLAIPSATPLLSPIPPDPAAQEEDEFDDNMESLPLAAIEAELKPKVLQAFDNIADAYKRLRRLQDQDSNCKPQRAPDWAPFPPTETDCMAGLRDGVSGLVAAVSGPLGGCASD